MNFAELYVSEFEAVFVSCGNETIAFPLDELHISTLKEWQDKFGHLAILFARLDVRPVEFTLNADTNRIAALELYCRGYIGYKKMSEILKMENYNFDST